MPSRSLIILNPNASLEMTADLERSVAPMRGASIDLRTELTPDGPPVIETDADVENAVGPMLKVAQSLEAQALGFAVACFSDPGVSALRAQSRHPVVGIREAAVMTALALGGRFGVVAILPASVTRQRAAFARMGVTDKWAGSRPLNLGVEDLANPAIASERVIAVARALCDDGADTLILGCAGMGGYKQLVEKETDRPVIEPTQAAIGILLGQVLGASA
ncbi:MAG: aspartate/glutamate racemase family protein [Rhodobacteraceae bacterium]|nr:aspartate/glutamate racemase family protein [Paracoccaceae bacterium]